MSALGLNRNNAGRDATRIRRNDLAGEVKGDGAFGWYTTAAEAVGNVGHVAGCTAGAAPRVAVGECGLSFDYDDLNLEASRLWAGERSRKGER